MTSDGGALLSADDLHVTYGAGTRLLRRLRLPGVRAVDGVSLSVTTGSVLGLVGESGSGKSTLGRALIGLEPPTSGCVSIGGVDLASVRPARLRRMRRRMQMVFQDPLGSLNPRMRIGAAVAEPIAEHHLAPNDRAVQARVDELLEVVGLRPAMKRRYPHELSGGQCHGSPSPVPWPANPT